MKGTMKYSTMEIPGLLEVINQRIRKVIRLSMIYKMINEKMIVKTRTDNKFFYHMF